MKLNHLILVICTGILVGFSACKKDPFTEADAIAAQKELITMKYGYELQLKNIEAAIQKAHDDAAIAMKNLEIKGASDLEKQKAAQQIAYLLASLQAERDQYVWRQKFDDSVTQAIRKRYSDSASAATIAAAYNALATTYNAALRFFSNDISLSGVTVKILRFDGTYFTGTTDANGYLFIKNEKFLPSAPASIVAPNTDKAIFPIYYTNPGVLMGYSIGGIFTPPSGISDGQKVTLKSYSPALTDSIQGDLRAIGDLRFGASQSAGAGLLVTANATIPSVGTNPGDTTSISISFVTSTLSTGAYKLFVAKSSASTSANPGYKVTAPYSVTAVVKGYGLVGSNPYQAMPSVVEVSRTLNEGSATTNAFDKIFNPTYYLSLPKSDHPGGYSVTLTDPQLLIPQLISGISVGGGNTPTGVSAAGTTMDTSKKYVIDPNAFLLNNGHLNMTISNDTNIYYNLPSVITLDSNDYKKYIALPAQVAGSNAIANNTTVYGYTDAQGNTPAGTTLFVSREQVRQKYFADLTAQVSSAVWTPTIGSSASYSNDTLAVDFVDLYGFVSEEPEFLAVVSQPNSNDPNYQGIGKGKVKSIILARGQEYGKFAINAVFGAAPNRASGSSDRSPYSSLYRNAVPGLTSSANQITNNTTYVESGIVQSNGTVNFRYASWSSIASSFKGISHGGALKASNTVGTNSTITLQSYLDYTPATARTWGTQLLAAWSNATIAVSNN